MKIRFQTPGNASVSLLQTLTDSSITSSSGGGVFAWASSYGASALLGSPDFEAFLARAPFRLIVGTDSITDLRAIGKLVEFSNKHPLLKVEALVNDERGLFHPKMTWFETTDSIRLVLGSGNLTKGGLLGNWEAFTVTDIPRADAEDLGTALDEWLSDANPGLLSLDDPRVLRRVALNAGDERALKWPVTRQAPLVSSGSDYSSWLVAELNKSRKVDGHSMFSQASFDQETFQRFFNYSGGEVDILLYPIAEDSSTGQVESRKGRYKAASVNYYFELGAVQGVPYPEDGRPVAVFGRLAEGGYVYRVFIPGDLGHDELASWLSANVSIPTPTRMRRAVVTTQTLTNVWPKNPLLAAELAGS